MRYFLSKRAFMQWLFELTWRSRFEGGKEQINKQTDTLISSYFRGRIHSCAICICIFHIYLAYSFCFSRDNTLNCKLNILLIVHDILTKIGHDNMTMKKKLLFFPNTLIIWKFWKVTYLLDVHFCFQFRLHYLITQVSS